MTSAPATPTPPLGGDLVPAPGAKACLSPRMALAIAIGWSALILMAILFLDRPIAFYAHAHLHQHAIFDPFTHIPNIVVTLAGLSMIVIGLARVWDRLTAPLYTVILQASIATFLAEEIKSGLKDIFGRTWPETWVEANPSLIGSGTYLFHFFPGHANHDWYQSFPSGHTTVTSAAMVVFCITWPRLWPLWALPVLLVMVGLIGMNYHFFSDTLGGLGVGTATAAVVMTLARKSQRAPGA